MVASMGELLVALKVDKRVSLRVSHLVDPKGLLSAVLMVLRTVASLVLKLVVLRVVQLVVS